VLCINDLLALEFQHLPQHRLDWVCNRAQFSSERRNPGSGGEAGRGFFVLSSGRIGITRLSEEEIPTGQHQAPAFFGEVQILTDEPVLTLSPLVLVSCI